VQEQDNSGYNTLNWWGCCVVARRSKRIAGVYRDLSSDRILEFLLLNRDFPTRSATAWTGYAMQSNRSSAAAAAAPEELTSVSAGCTPCWAIPPSAKFWLETRSLSAHDREQCMRIHELIYRYYVHYSIQSALAI